MPGQEVCSPRTWGWPPWCADLAREVRVLPTHVGMVRAGREHPRPTVRAPHARGDGPSLCPPVISSGQCSPRTWGWSAVTCSAVSQSTVLPTHVGMVRLVTTRDYAEVRAPHARGDGPLTPNSPVIIRVCSPRTWGWSVRELAQRHRREVLPTHVGMVRGQCGRYWAGACAPHARGDGPARTGSPTASTPCSPRTWGWSHDAPCRVGGGGVLPTHVGMVRGPRPRNGRGDRAPRARGDGVLPGAGRARGGSTPESWDDRGYR